MKYKNEQAFSNRFSYIHLFLLDKTASKHVNKLANPFATLLII